MSSFYGRIKARFVPGLLVFIWLLIGYFGLQNVEIRSVWWLDASFEERWVPHRPVAVWPYLSYFLMVPLAGLTIRDEDYLDFIWAAFGIASVSFLFFAMLPTGLSREGLDLEQLPKAYHWFIRIDQPRNLFPSLHVSLACLAAVFWSKLGKWPALIGWLWAAAIAWSALSLRQHVWGDVLGAFVLSLLASHFVQKRCR